MLSDAGVPIEHTSRLVGHSGTTTTETIYRTRSGRFCNRLPAAVERTVPFALLTQSIVIIWYHLAGHHPPVVRGRRAAAPGTAKACPLYLDMIVRLRRILILAQFSPEVPRQPTPEEIRAIHLAWADAAA